jgi:hypothetical protein
LLGTQSIFPTSHHDNSAQCKYERAEQSKHFTQQKAKSIFIHMASGEMSMYQDSHHHAQYSSDLAMSLKRLIKLHD